MPPRTKSCAICRKKRMKCDATPPQCLMCIRTGRECPGIPEGPLFVDMTAKAGVGMKRRSKNNPVIQEPARVNQTPQDYIIDNLLLPQMYQISHRAMVIEAFYAKFLAYFTSDGERYDLQNKKTWLHQLPQLAMDGSYTALTLAVQATASAYCGVETGNMSVVRDAWNTYGKALSMHARIIRSNPKVVTVHMISTSVMLSLLEAMSSTTSDAYREHISGAAKMLEATGPGECSQGVLCQLFFHIRTQMAFVYLTTRKSQRIPVKKILIETLAYERLPTFQRLMSHIGMLAEIYVDKTSPGSKEQLIDLAVYSGVKADIDALYLEYKEQAESRGEVLSWKTSDGRTDYRDSFTALSLAYFSAARILLTILAPRLAATFPNFTDHYASILSCAYYLKAHRIGCAYMRMAMPLYLVAVHSPEAEQRMSAIGNFCSSLNVMYKS
ncbi:hypothetical protein K504DRAFT_457620 [Pleomassaria siparia CBS 279.74]|uniref:Zn(2)-C6 fungal-type domain-containing protein n=1 Tax=Pleomassaria siparia CBS 279.74 TaxID=1314801 RepID=A0A6G1KRD7_9PLEO|nr:hypothetical protein K504DRAFT_457620 [Pleomassaria siparia CBS 279.74]